ncbi:hypothetical protein TRP8649_00660 [Pelagimonas phthalicica]|uniref:Restriction endonuclease type IV Mrr domain-containing protein n=1 Tax=Pelagimonas phthalicica TaxID=1037362 RepID=A0A238J9M7_9RHOB|nr:restriction endonuclease [Pelagimonas phthalicica]TDS94898.1 restriction endonuclease [Pelagimonas phthalicica]SMX26576.1 hypothetical protein TRP8649_00660 [Pelagimonas phthalicica]
MKSCIPHQINLESDNLLLIIKSIEAEADCPKHVSVIIPAYAIGRASEHLSICEDILDVSFVAEAMAARVHNPQLSMERQSNPPYRTQFVFEGCEPEPGFLDVLRQACIHFGGDDPEIAEQFSDYFDKYPDTMEQYKKDLDEAQFFFPALVDDYYANLINGAYYTYEQTDWVQTDLARYPERRFGFHRSAFSTRLGGDAYASIESWIVPEGVDLDDLFEVLNQDVKISQFHAARLTMMERACIATTGSQHVHFPLDGFLKARVCQSFLGEEDQVLRLGWQQPLFSTSPSLLSSQAARGQDALEQTAAKHDCLVHESGELIVLSDKEEGWHHLFFDTRPLNTFETKALADRITQLSESVEEALGLSAAHQFDWRTLNDEQFETLCYDIIYSHPGFNHETIRKMGKARSRDGGRDIVVWTQPLAYREPSRKFVFQCKLVTSKKSLGKRDVTDIGDMLDQYGADGFGIMTSTVIDATLFDAADAI